MATGLGKLRRANGRERLERANAVAEVRDQRSPAMIAGEPADLGQEGVARASCVELGDEIDRRLQTRALAPISERLGTEVLVHVPHPAPFSLRRSRQESRAALAETECRQPALRDEAVGVRDSGGVAFEHERAVGSTADSEPVDTLLQTLETDGVR